MPEPAEHYFQGTAPRPEHRRGRKPATISLRACPVAKALFTDYLRGIFTADGVQRHAQANADKYGHEVAGHSLQALAQIGCGGRCNNNVERDLRNIRISPNELVCPPRALIHTTGREASTTAGRDQNNASRLVPSRMACFFTWCRQVHL